ncbi:MAG: glutamate synthase large subunit [Anaerolineae bacterium]
MNQLPDDPDQCTRRRTLYDPRFEHDACGIGFIADVSGRPSHDILSQALQALSNMAHRGAIAADGKTGDGAGILTQLPRKLLAREAARMGWSGDPADLGVGMFFLPRRRWADQGRCRDIIEATIARHDLCFIGWRAVPVDLNSLGERAAAVRPDIHQALIARPAHLATHDAYERALYLARRDIEAQIRRENIGGFYAASMSCRTIVYKGLFVAPQLPQFYLDLSDTDYTTGLAVFHQRYSTNTFPTWERAQPFRVLCHNGEINTLQGNVNWMRAREADLSHPGWGADIALMKPVVDMTGSDSAMLDNALEMLNLSGRDLPHALLMLAPEAWEKIDLPQAWRDFYAYHAGLMEPWDGPAALTFTDGRTVGTILDRNGLRPARFLVTHDGLVLAASEAGVLPVAEERIARKGKLGPGQIIIVDVERHVVLTNDEVKDEVSDRQPYGEWVAQNMRTLPPVEDTPTELGTISLGTLQAAFGYTSEELTAVIRPMVLEGAEPVGSMGDDTPHAVLAEKYRPLYNYFKQRFAEVTNPPIDPLREEAVMSLTVRLGRRPNVLAETPEHARLLHLGSPFLSDAELAALRAYDDDGFQSATLRTLFKTDIGPESLERSLAALCGQAIQAVNAGKTILILSDRGVDRRHAPIPMLLAVGAVHHTLLRRGLRMRCSIVAETAEAREVHHLAVLLGYGANAVNPYLALATARHTAEEGHLRNKGVTAQQAEHAFVKAAEKGVLKIMSKMGIATVDSYTGAQIFEAIGLDNELVERCFTETPCRTGGLGFRMIAERMLRLHKTAFASEEEPKLDNPGFYKFKKGGEYHAFSPQVVHALHKAVTYAGALNGGFEEGYRLYKEYSSMLSQPPRPSEPRDMMEWKIGRPVPVEEVEPIESILRRFSTAAMSIGALSPEAHGNLAIAISRLGGLSNSGEGGEVKARYGTEANSGIKQIASGRFGVTPEYLTNAVELQIKMAQGSKPGEGGQLPGHKVSVEIATIRHTRPGVALISPPPHHDIYSIEDLAQLIFDLRQINPTAKISVKLVAEAGVGTVAAGVIKGGADIVHISGHSGGTGASPLSSIKNAGIPWEIGLAETQQTLILNGLRDRAVVRTDGGLRVGRDVIIAALLGADEFSFGTAAVVAEGCLMARACHTNTCPVGIATQDPALRAKFPGTPEMVMAFFLYVATEVRETLAQMGFRRLDDIIGRVDLLRQTQTGLPAADMLDLSPVLTPADPEIGRPYRNERPTDLGPSVSGLQAEIVADAASALACDAPVHLRYPIRNIDRTIGATLAGEIAKRFGDEGLPPGTIRLDFEGTAGQSFGAFGIEGMVMRLVGEANDYVGKGLSGGEIAIRPKDEATYEWRHNTIVGNTCLYGATGGALYAAGRAGERFAVRNSGAVAVVEGVGDHGCEYMTGGVALILGSTGRNFGAGMTGGVAYVLDEDSAFEGRVNTQLVRLERLDRPGDVMAVRSLLKQHFDRTNSPLAWRILANWATYRGQFWKVAPKETAGQQMNEDEGTHADWPSTDGGLTAVQAVVMGRPVAM